MNQDTENRLRNMAEERQRQAEQQLRDEQAFPALLQKAQEEYIGMDNRIRVLLDSYMDNELFTKEGFGFIFNGPEYDHRQGRNHYLLIMTKNGINELKQMLEIILPHPVTDFTAARAALKEWPSGYSLRVVKGSAIYAPGEQPRCIRHEEFMPIIRNGQYGWVAKESDELQSLTNLINTAIQERLVDKYI